MRENLREARMNEISVFSSQEFGEVRSVEIDNKQYFINKFLSKEKER